MIIDVRTVRHLGGFRLLLTFEDGVSGEVDLARHIEFTGVFSPLADPQVFGTVRVDPDLGTICWECGADIDPLVLYSWVTGKALPAFSDDKVA